MDSVTSAPEPTRNQVTNPETVEEWVAFIASYFSGFVDATRARYTPEIVRRIKEQAWQEGCLAGFAAASKGIAKHDDDEGMQRRLSGIEKLNPYHPRQ